MMNRILNFALVSALIAFPALAEDMQVLQKDRQFSKTTIVAKPGDRIVFQNADEFTHNLISLTPGSQFGSHMQDPGQTIAMTLKAEGEFDVQCLIHRKMKLHVVVHK